MADFEYIGSGGAETLGCAEYSMQVYYTYAFEVGSIVYLKHKAKKGILERVAIKRIFIRQNKATWGQPIFIYQDTLNSLYNEADLVTHQQAVDLTLIYHENIQLNTLAALRLC